MKRKTNKRIKTFWDIVILLSAILTIFTTLPVPAMAGSITLTATCSIPAIPGVNSPMLESQSTSTETNPREGEKATPQNPISAQNAAREQLPTIMQEEVAKPAQHPVAANPAALMITRTLYSR